jgi:hypothetical protein
MRRAIFTVLLIGGGVGLVAQSVTRTWKAHDPARPKPAIVAPGATPGAPPSDAVVLFDGTSLSAWSAADGSPAQWKLADGAMETAPGAGAIATRRAFGDAQLHLEFATPATVSGSGQGRGNSGVIFMGLYEVQVLDSYGNETYADGQAAAIYGQYPPMVNASRGPGEWQSYDVVFRRPRFSATGTLVSPARMTVFHNGVLVQDNMELWGPTRWLEHGPYERHADSLPLVLQDHANPVRYRNVWVRPLPPREVSRGLTVSRATARVPASTLRRYVGTYGTGGDVAAVVRLRGTQLVAEFLDNGVERPLVPLSPTRFTLPRTESAIEFVERPGQPTLIRFAFAEVRREAPRIR